MVLGHLHQELIQACKDGNIEGVQQCLDAGADPNFNIKSPANALHTAIGIENHQVIKLLLKRGIIVTEFVLQKAIERDKSYLHLLLPNFKACKDKTLLMGVLQAAINIDEVNLAKQAIHQGAKPESLHISAVRNLGSTEILALLLENDFDIHADSNMVLSHWMGGWRDSRPTKLDLLTFISNYYLEKPNAIAEFKASILHKSLLFRIGLDDNNLPIMRFALAIGVNKSESLNAALYRYYAKNHEDINKKIVYEIIEYILNSDIKFDETTIANAVCFKYTELLNALRHRHDLEYGYEMAYTYDNDDLCDYFSQRGVSQEAQCCARMKVSAIKGNLKALRKAVNEGANVEELDTDVIVEVINKNQVEVLKYFHDSGILFDRSLNGYLDKAMSSHKAYESISYLIELGLDITRVKKIPLEYRKKYPAIADMWDKRFADIFDYTLHLAKEVHPKVEGKKKEAILQRIAQLSSLPYVIKKSEVLR